MTYTFGDALFDEIDDLGDEKKTEDQVLTKVCTKCGVRFSVLKSFSEAKTDPSLCTLCDVGL